MKFQEAVIIHTVDSSLHWKVGENFLIQPSDLRVHILTGDYRGLVPYDLRDTVQFNLPDYGHDTLAKLVEKLIG